METPYDDTFAKIYTNYSGHMTEMATVTIYGKTPLNIFLSGTNDLGMWALPGLHKL